MEKVVQLKDGTEVLIRPMTAEDAEKSFAFFQALPEEDQRFLRHDVTKRSNIDRRIKEIGFGNVERIVALVGDEIVAIWGAPAEQPNHAELAVRAGVEMEQEILRLHEKWKQAGLPILDMGVGINTGEMVVGNIGSQRKMDYTVIGDNVNLGARVEALTRKFPHRVIVTDSTYDQVKEKVDAVHLDFVTVKGKQMPVKVWGVKGMKSSA